MNESSVADRGDAPRSAAPFGVSCIICQCLSTVAAPVRRVTGPELFAATHKSVRRSYICRHRLVAEVGLEPTSSRL